MDETSHQHDVEIENSIVEDVIGVAANDVKIENDAVVPHIGGKIIEDTANDVEIESDIAPPIIENVIEESREATTNKTTDIKTTI